jgi:hypothetical protein
MRFFDNWWEYLPTVVRLARLAPLILAVLAMLTAASIPDYSSLLDHYWE